MMPKNRWLHISVVLCVVYTISIFSQPLRSFYLFSFIAIGFMLGGYILAFKISEDIVLHPSFVIFYILWIAILGGSALEGIRPGYSWLWLLKWGAILYISLWFFIFIVQREKWIHESIGAVNIVFVAIAIAHLFWRLSGYWRFNLSIPLLIKSWRLFAFPWGHPNLSAQFLVLMTGYFIGLLSKINEKQRRQVVLYIVVALYALLLILTVSRGGWLAWWGVLGTYFGLTVWHQRWWKKDWNFWLKRKSKIAFWVLLLISWLLLANWRLRERFVGANAQSATSLSGRELLWQAAWDAFRQSPLIGIGYGNFPAWLAIKGISPPFPLQSHAHNIFLHIAAETGILGLVVWFGFWGWLGYKVSRRILNRRLTGFENGILASLVGIWLQGMVESWFVYPNLWLIVFVFVGFLLKNEAQKIARPTRFLLLLSLLVYVGVWSAKVAFPQYLSWRGARALKSAHWGQAEIWYQKAAQHALWPVTDLWRAGQVVLLRDGEQGIEAAVSYYRQALLIEPWYAPRWAALALLQFEMGDIQRARVSMNIATTRAPLDARLWWLRGWLAYRAHDVDDAQFAFARSVTLQSDFYYTTEIWLHSALDKREFVRKSQWYQLLLEGKTAETRGTFWKWALQGRSEGWAGLAIIAVSEGQPDQAERYLQIARFLGEAPEIALAYAYLNQYYEYDDYLERYQQALNISSSTMLTLQQENTAFCDYTPCPGVWPATIKRVEGMENWLWMFFVVQNSSSMFEYIR